MQATSPLEEYIENVTEYLAGHIDGRALAAFIDEYFPDEMPILIFELNQSEHGSYLIRVWSGDVYGLLLSCLSAAEAEHEYEKFISDYFLWRT